MSYDKQQASISGGKMVVSRFSAEECDVKDGESNVVKFICCVCGLTENCHYGPIKISGRTHAFRYQEEVYYMLDPFRDRSKMDERRLATATNITRRFEGNKSSSILDIFVLGALCSICGQSVCIDELCSIFYTKTFCTLCVTREKGQFPKEIVDQVETARKQREKREAERKGAKTSC